MEKAVERLESLAIISDPQNLVNNRVCHQHQIHIRTLVYFGEVYLFDYSETKRPRRLLDLQSEELQGGNDSTLSLNTDGDASLADLSRKVIVTSLTVITNYLMLSSQPSEGVLYELNRIYKMSESLASAGMIT